MAVALRITVAICTWNRAKLLDQTLAEMRKLIIPLGVEWELIVVNNNCTDDTNAVLDRYVGKLPLVRLFEPKAGQSNARNCAQDAARGDLLIWTDDDVLVPANWLRAYVEASNRWPESAYFGGPIEPAYEVPPPGWLVNNIDLVSHALVIRELGDIERPLECHEAVFGANMAFRRGAFARLRFDATMGLVGTVQTRGDETDYVGRLRSDGGFGVWVPDARLRHYTPRQRVTSSFIWDWFDGAGRLAVRSQRAPIPGRTFWGVPPWLVRSYAESRLMSLLLGMTRSRKWLQAYKSAAYFHGMIRECREMKLHHANHSNFGRAT